MNLTFMESRMSSVADNLAGINERIALACARARRDPSQVQLVGVTKMVSIDRIIEGVNAGVKVLGENYVQEALQKIIALQSFTISWHFIGHLQSNKAKIAVEPFDLIHTVDREGLAKELNLRGGRIGKRISVLLQVKLGQEETKSGIAPGGVIDLCQYVSSLDNLTVRGLMALPPYLDDPEQVRPYFRQLRLLLERLKERSAKPEELTELSMGMSHDFEVAIEEGATLIRVGTVLFGERPGE
jgi:PLP dependent protein